MKNEHDDVSLEGEPIDAFFEVNILKAYQQVFTRLVNEGTNLNSHNGQILNSKTGWHQPKIIRNIIIQGGAEQASSNMGRRPSPSPPTGPAIATPVNTVPASSTTGVSSRSTRSSTRRAMGQ